jgi:hypothetical protein
MKKATPFMTRHEYIQKKITILKQTLVSFQRWSILLFGIGITSFFLSFFVSFDKSLELLKFGLSSMATLSGIALQGVKYLYKCKLVELEYSLDLIDHYEKLKGLDKKIVDSALDKMLAK